MLVLGQKMILTTITATTSITRLPMLLLTSLRIRIRVLVRLKNIIKIGVQGKRNSMRTSKVSFIEMIHLLLFRMTRSTKRRPPYQ